MKLEELKKALRETDQGAVLVSQRLLARVIQEAHHLPTQFLQVSSHQVPHHRSFVIDRQVLFRHVEQDELDLDPDRLLPATVILLVRPSAEEGDLPDRAKTLLYYWQRLFHANIDRALDERIKAGQLTTADLRGRIAEIGEVEFDEIRSVLRRDLWLLPPVDDVRVYREFGAVYLELRFFLPNLLPVYFPALRDFGKIDALIARDVDADAIWRATRLPGAPDPQVQGDNRSDDSHEYYHKLVRGAVAASKAKNDVRAAILRMKAARVAPGSLTYKTRNEAHRELQHLTDRLKGALHLTDTEASAWQIALVSLLEKADQGHWTVEARLLYDLQQVCIDAEREVFQLDLVEWVLSALRRPIKRPLPSQRLVQMTRHLNAAWQRIPLARLSDDDRQHLTKLIQSALQRSEEHLRARFRPIFSDALHDAGLVANNPPEETALRKMIEELLDRITSVGFFTFGDLRDAISRNSLKMADLSDPQEFVRGDPLLRLDRRLATLLDGVYRPGEVYFRLLSRSTSLLFGTMFGRFATTNILLPFGGAYVTLFGLKHIIKKPIPFSDIAGPDIPLPFWSFVPIGLLILGLMHLPKMRRACMEVWRVVRDGARLAVYGPIWLVRLPAVQRVWKSWLFQLLWWYALKPLAVSLMILPFLHDEDHIWLSFLVIFGIVAVVLNSRLGHAANEILAIVGWQLYDTLRSGLIPGLIRFVMQLLKRAMDGMERLLYSIDELLRFRSGDSQASLIARTILGVLWYPVAFFTRLYVVVFVEPMFHPLKLPIAILAAKFVYLRYDELLNVQAGWLSHITTPVLAKALAAVNTWLLPDLFGFLFWEFRENWRLYRANRSPVLKPVLVGYQGETMPQLLKPGFHAGTLPRLFDQLRKAERLAMASGQWRTARAYRQQLQEVEEAVRLFVERELIVLLHQSRSWQDKPLRSGKIELATQLIRFELEHHGHSGKPARWALAEKSGWLTVQVEESGWLAKLSARQLESLTTALAGWYKLAGIDVVREHVQAALAGTGLTYAVEEQGLALRSARRSEEIVYPMLDTIRIKVHQPGKQPTHVPSLPPIGSFIFARLPIYWDHWVEAWLRERDGQPPLLLPEGLALLPAEVGGALTEVAPEERNGEDEVREAPVRVRAGE